MAVMPPPMGVPMGVPMGAMGRGMNGGFGMPPLAMPGQIAPPPAAMPPMGGGLGISPLPVPMAAPPVPTAPCPQGTRGPLSPEQTALPVGARVTAHGLKGAQHLNGLIGTVHGHMPDLPDVYGQDAGRVVVVFAETGAEEFALKPANLERVGGAPAAPGGPWGAHPPQQWGPPGVPPPAPLGVTGMLATGTCA